MFAAEIFDRTMGGRVRSPKMAPLTRPDRQECLPHWRISAERARLNPRTERPMSKEQTGPDGDGGVTRRSFLTSAGAAGGVSAVEGRVVMGQGDGHTAWAAGPPG